jgi:hypothetical protein
MTDDETIAVRVTVIGGQRLDCTDSPAARDNPYRLRPAI